MGKRSETALPLGSVRDRIGEALLAVDSKLYAEWQQVMEWEDELLAHSNEMATRLDSLREPMQLSYGYFVALVNHGGDTKIAATKGRDHLREAIRRLDA